MNSILSNANSFQALNEKSLTKLLDLVDETLFDETLSSQIQTDFMIEETNLCKNLIYLGLFSFQFSFSNLKNSFKYFKVAQVETNVDLHEKLTFPIQSEAKNEKHGDKASITIKYPSKLIQF